MIIFGVQWGEQPIKSAPPTPYPCPRCHVTRDFKEFRMRKVFTLYWYPVFTLERGAHFWKCEVCGGNYEIPAEEHRRPPA